MVDKKKIGIAQGVDISFLSEEAQQWVAVILEETEAAVNASQSAKLKEYGKNGGLTLEMVRLILDQEKPKERKVTIKSDKINKYFPEEYSNDDIEGIIIQLWRNGRVSSKGGGKMGEPLKFDYYYGIEAEQFSFTVFPAC